MYNKLGRWEVDFNGDRTVVTKHLKDMSTSIGAWPTPVRNVIHAQHPLLGHNNVCIYRHVQHRVSISMQRIPQDLSDAERSLLSLGHGDVAEPRSA
ncbi:hypothetical protein CEXT_46361 [Caerostris extrusa]|uniref:Uncharacterized protein n=1 Tax=Caerostris extrusa TaxID=172846 RepID=A0AAV4MX97_CAEEX|nr:hypothetical protein CEXT_46361 [Caerostris extrusa]